MAESAKCCHWLQQVAVSGGINQVLAVASAKCWQLSQPSAGSGISQVLSLIAAGIGTDLVLSSVA